ncbi:GTPase [Coprinopsis marcescibilis]|uniref:Guanine nucleotide-binding protein-like 1 n=1 Tax=Coprinopsis marcescibilis TaxID=230819 RepID=A0A5C3LCW2_COPMA|nr:GTPase [Coprinopsis marcescibilis]
MPPRRKPTSTKQKKEDQKLRRAIKRGDAPAPEPTKKPPRKRKGKLGPTGVRVEPEAASIANVESAKRLQSAFVKVSPAFLEETKVLASNVPLTRPIPTSRSEFATFDVNLPENKLFICPRRPKWRFDMSKEMVENNEEALYKKWLSESDDLVENWRSKHEARRKEDENSSQLMPASITHYERNIEVWRQLWRVGEISQILLVLLDSRCPTLHYPPSLASYLEKKKVVLVLTKADITGPARVEAWKAYLRDKHPGFPIIEVESYAEKGKSAVHQGKKQFVPSIPLIFREKLIGALKQVHSELATPPERVSAHPERLKSWVPFVKREIDWDALLHASGDKVGHSIGSANLPRTESEEPTADESDPDYTRKEPDILTIGLIGQPNVGKSSLLNALFGTRKVKASKTPGKTKHFQTLFWTPDVRLVDCPGLVVPNFTPMEMQVLSGVLPLSRVSAIAFCTHFAAQLLPLERVLNLVHPSTLEPEPEDKRTWRDGTRPKKNERDAHNWTSMDILTSYALSKGWLTAKAGRPDVNRAGNAILRALAEGRISWGFWPPGSSPPRDDGLGIWIPSSDPTRMEFDSEDEEDGHASTSESDGEANTGSQDESEEGEEVEDDDDDFATGQNIGVGRFEALALEDDGSEGSEGSED